MASSSSIESGASAASSASIAFTGPLHILAEQCQWDELALKLEQLLKTKQLYETSSSSSTSTSTSTSTITTNSADYNIGNDKINFMEQLQQLEMGQGKYSWTPLMLCCARHAPPHVIELLLQCSPQSIHISDDSGTFPLHFVCAWWNSKCSDTYKRNDNNDQEIHKSDDEESVLYSEEKLYKVLQTLLQVCPKALTYRNEWGMTPMHCIFDRGEGLQPVSIEILKLLLGLNKGNEKSVIMKKEKNRNDEKEHQRAIQDTKIYDLEENTINTHALIALSVPDSNDYLPLHTAASNGACEDILRLLLTLHPEAALTTTTDGDLPIHLLQYWAENEAKNKSFSDNNTSSRNSNSQTKSNWLYDSGVFQISKSYIFYSTQVGQIEALLEPICILRYDKSVTSASVNSTSPNRVETEEIDEGEYHQNAMKIAARLPGSRNVLLPIHIAAEHGVSFEILAALCKTYPEGVMTPQPTGASSHGSKKSLSSMGNETTPKWPHEKYPIELFESGRAGRYAEKMAHLQKIHLENPENKVLTNSTFMASSMDMNQILLELKSFDDRRDLLFAYYPDAIPSKYIEERDSRQNIIIPTIGNIDPRHAQRRKSTVLYSNDSHRIRRIEQRIRSEAILPSFQDFSITSKRLWKWMYQGVNSPGDRLKSNHQSSIGRIITDLSQIALMKLSYYSLSSSELQGDVDFMKRVPCVIQGTSILDMAKDRAAKITMSELFSKSESNWQSVVCEYLSAKDGLMFNSICTKTKGRGLRYLSESNLPETGRSWTFFSPNDREDSSMFEFWQYVDSSLIIPECTHTVIMKYYLEVSDDKMFEFEDTDEPLSLGNTKGGLMVVSETTPSKDIDNDSIERKIVASMPKLMLHPTFRTPPGFEVCLSFRYNPSLSYYVRSYGPPSGGRVSVSNARLQQVIYSIDRKNQTPLQVLLGNQQTKFQTPTSTQIDLITKDVDTTEYPLHLALEYGAPIEILKKLIDKNPSLLLKRNEEGCTPLHHVFLISEKIRPTIGIVNALLTTPGENAARLKDASDRLPLHIASEIGAAAAILDLLIDANTDGCYRMNRDGDLPVHLLTRSGKAMTSTVELLLAPIVDSETICGVPGSQGMELPLHIAAEYNCSYKIIERLLLSYGEAASIPRRKSIMNEAQSSQTFALDIFEANRRDQEKKQLSVRSLSRSDSGISVKTISTIATEDMVQQEMKQADFDLRSDLLFVFNPLVSNHRKDVNRIKRLQNIIRKEAMKCAEFLTVDQKVEMSEMSQLAWSFFCTFENPADPDDEYSQIVGQVLKSLTYPVVQILSEVRNPFSTLLSHLPVIDCATKKCKRLLSSRLLFAGRFKLNSTSGVIHKSKDILVINANDHGAEEAYRRFVSTFKKVEEEIKDFDDIVSCHSGTIGHVQSFGDDPQSEDDPQSLFVDFASKLGLEEDEGSKEFEKLLLLTNSSPRTSLNDLQSKEERREINLDIFRLFCETHRVDRSGIRNVAIKFMKNRTQFLREKVVRARISNLENDCYIYPIIEDFDVDRAEKTSKRLSNESVESYKVHESICDSKDGIYAMDISENNFAGLNFVSFKYAIVLPCGHKTLEDIMLHENPDGTEARNMLKTVGRTIKGLHDRSVVHGNLIASNIVRMMSKLGLIDFDSATLVDTSGYSSVLCNKIGGVSQKLSSGILPPELIAKVGSQQLQTHDLYWDQISRDSADYNMLSVDDNHVISAFVLRYHNEQHSLNRTNISIGLSSRTFNDMSIDGLSELGWRERLSDALEDISVDDLPDSLSNCVSFDEFQQVWDRVNSNVDLWERIRPYHSEDRTHAYCVKYFNDVDDECNSDGLPYSLVSSNYNIDIWAFGVLIFTACSRSPLFPITVDGQLRDYMAYKELCNWSIEFAKRRISSAIRDPIAQDLLLKLLVPEDQRISSMDAVLAHPFFGPSASIEAQNILEEYEEQHLRKIEHTQLQVLDCRYRRDKQPHSMEKHCKVVFQRLEDITFPTNLVVLPYTLQLNMTTHELEIPRDHEHIVLGEIIGDQLIKVNTIMAKLLFWLRMKEHLSNKGGTQFKENILCWIKRARHEGSNPIAKEIVAAIGCDERYIGICIEMLDEEMSVSNARAFIRDPIKAAAMLMEGVLRAMLGCFNRHFMYLIDEFSSIPSFSLGNYSEYPTYIETTRTEMNDIMLPFMIMSTFVVTDADGLEGLSRLLGFPSSFPISKSWIKSNVDFIQPKGSNISNQSTSIQFSTLYNILRQSLKEMTLRQTRSNSILVSETLVNIDLDNLQAMYREKDPEGNFAGLFRKSDVNDTSLTFWTSESTFDDHSKHDQEFTIAFQRVEELRKEIMDRQKLEEEIVQLHQRFTSQKEETKERKRLREERHATKKAALVAKTQGPGSVQSKTSNSTTLTSNILPRPIVSSRVSQSFNGSSHISSSGFMWKSEPQSNNEERKSNFSSNNLSSNFQTNDTPFNTPSNVLSSKNHGFRGVSNTEEELVVAPTTGANNKKPLFYI